MRNFLLILFPIVLCVPGLAFAQTTIHQCKGADGGVVYSQLPCKDEVPTKSVEPAESEEAAQPENAVAEPPEPDATHGDAQTGESRSACKKRYRDEIDLIDAEIRREYTPEKDAEYKQRLLALTRKLREC